MLRSGLALLCCAIGLAALAGCSRTPDGTLAMRPVRLPEMPGWAARRMPFVAPPVDEAASLPPPPWQKNAGGTPPWIDPPPPRSRAFKVGARRGASMSCDETDDKGRRVKVLCR